jgi:hypothetical protein
MAAGAAATAAGMAAAADAASGAMPAAFFDAAWGTAAPRRPAPAAAPGNPAPPAPAAAAFAADPARGSDANNSASASGWFALRQRFLALFGSSSSSSSSAAGGVSDSKDELSSNLMDLSEDLMAQV